MEVPFRGAGGVTVLIGVAAFFLQLMAPALPWLFIAAAINFLLGWLLNRKLNAAGVPPEQQHSVADVPMQWVSILFVIMQFFVVPH